MKTNGNFPKHPYLLECIAITTDDGGLGFVGVKDHILFLWPWYAGPDGIAGWVQHRSFELSTLLPTSLWYNTISFAEGTDTIVMSTSASVFAIKLKSGHVRNLCVTGSYYSIVPYMSFYVPDNLKHDTEDEHSICQRDTTSYQDN
ncbi:hypothetical protein EJB05_14209, partial [Eragrostis curvula]